MSLKHRIVVPALSFAASAAVAIVATATPEASADDRHQHVAACWATDPATIDYSQPSRGLLSTLSGTARTYCPVLEDSQITNAGVRRIHVHGADATNAGQVTARACVTFWDVDTGGECGPPDNNGANSVTGNYTIQLTGTGSGQELFALRWAADFAYVRVDLPVRQDAYTGGSTLRGLFISNTTM